MTETDFGMFRHGQTDWNVNFLLQGTTDIPMNQTGIEQTLRATKFLDPTDWDVLLCSPLVRARQTADILVAELGLPAYTEDPLLIERSFGEAEGLSYDQWRSKYSSLDEVPGGESRSALEKRSGQILQNMIERYAGKRVLAVSHGALIRTVIALSSQGTLPRAGERLGNASLNVVGHDSLQWKVVSYDLNPLGESTAQ